MPDNKQQFPKKNDSPFQYTFSVPESGIYTIMLSARCARGGDLRVEIDGVKFREIPPLDKIGTIYFHRL